MRWQPVSPPLMAVLVEHAEHRCAALPEDRLLRHRAGRPITHRRCDHLFDRLGRYLLGRSQRRLRALTAPHHVDLG